MSELLGVLRPKSSECEFKMLPGNVSRGVPKSGCNAPEFARVVLHKNRRRLAIGDEVGKLPATQWIDLDLIAEDLLQRMAVLI